jgi:putative hemolysin
MDAHVDIAARIAPLIAERAPWLAGASVPARLTRPVLNALLGHDRTVAVASALAPRPGPAVMDTAARLIARRVTATGLAHVPASGPALIVANHPTGIADGLVLWRLLARRRPDAFFFANADVLRVLPQLHTVIAPVEWRPEKKTRARTRATLCYARSALLDQRRLGVIFPSGRLAKRRGLRLHERPWMTSAATLARKFDLDIIPVHLSARNSALFYAFDALHPTLRDVTLFHETLNKPTTPYRVTIGPAIPARALPADPAEATARLRRATLALGEDPASRGQSLFAAEARAPDRGFALLPRA